MKGKMLNNFQVVKPTPFSVSLANSVALHFDSFILTASRKAFRTLSECRRHFLDLTRADSNSLTGNKTTTCVEVQLVIITYLYFDTYPYIHLHPKTGCLTYFKHKIQLKNEMIPIQSNKIDYCGHALQGGHVLQRYVSILVMSLNN